MIDLIVFRYLQSYADVCKLFLNILKLNIDALFSKIFSRWNGGATRQSAVVKRDLKMADCAMNSAINGE